jgi:hypothetical protein
MAVANKADVTTNERMAESNGEVLAAEKRRGRAYFVVRTSQLPKNRRLEEENRRMSEVPKRVRDAWSIKGTGVFVSSITRRISKKQSTQSRKKKQQ